jgi:hypothetical protein
VDLPAHAWAEARVDHLVPLQRALALELARNDDGLEVRVVVRADVDVRAWQAGQDQLFHLVGIHGSSVLGLGGGGRRRRR